MELLEQLTSHNTLKMDKEIELILGEIGLILKRYNEIELHGNGQSILFEVKENGEILCTTAKDKELEFLPLLQEILEDLEVNRRKLAKNRTPYSLESLLGNIYKLFSNIERISIR